MSAQVEMRTDAIAAECPLDHCITCGDEAVPMRVLALDEARGLALCETGAGERETVEIALVDAVPGDQVLVHAAVALQRVAE